MDCGIGWVDGAFVNATATLHHRAEVDAVQGRCQIRARFLQDYDKVFPQVKAIFCKLVNAVCGILTIR